MGAAESPGRSLRRPSVWLECGLGLAGIVLLSLWVREYDQARAFRLVETKKLEAARESAGLDGGGAAIGKPSPPAMLEGGVLGRIEIPRLGISALIAEGTGSQELDKAIGHIASSAFPGEKGNCALAGHRDSFLRGLGQVRKKDLIRIDTPRDSYTYQVEWGSVVDPENVKVLDDTREPSLTLVTCYPFQVIGPAPERFVVRARLVDATD